MDFYVWSDMALNFTPNFIELIRILRNNPTFRVMNNGISSKTCRMTRDIRQGCPVSSTVKFNSWNTKIYIHGIKFGNDNEIKMIQLADDSTYPLRDIKSFKNEVKLIHKFSNVAGLKLNINNS